jgi:hypothetical protein
MRSIEIDISICVFLYRKEQEFGKQHGYKNQATLKIQIPGPPCGFQSEFLACEWRAMYTVAEYS